MSLDDPWRLREDDIGGWYIDGHDGQLVAETIRDEAKAHLVAAAPELLEALKALYEAERNPEYVKAGELARAAIAKAEGR